MTPDEKKLLSDTYQLVQENNEILKKMHRSAKWGRAFRIFYWGIIIILSIGSYYLIQPYIDQLGGVYSGFKTQTDSVHNAADQFKDLFQ